MMGFSRWHAFPASVDKARAIHVGREVRGWVVREGDKELEVRRATTGMKRGFLRCK